MNNHDDTEHLGKLNDTWMPLDTFYHSDVLQECVHVVGEKKVYEFQECISIDEIPQLMTPSWQAI